MKTKNIAITMLLIAAVTFSGGCKKKEVPQTEKEMPVNVDINEVNKPADVNESKPAESAKAAPDFVLKNYDGNSVSLKDLKGKIVVLEWLNYDCPFSKYHHETANTMMELAEKYKAKGVVWLGINSTNYMTAEKNKEFADADKINYPILDDRYGTVGREYGAKTTPHMFIINAEGMIAYNGAIDNSPMGEKKEGVVNYVDKALLELTEGKAVSETVTAPYGCSVKYLE